MTRTDRDADGFPLAYEVLPRNTADCTTLRGAQKIEAPYRKAQRIWVMLCAVLSYVECGPIGGRLRCSWEATSPHN
jgi:hypothetical protein